LIKTKFVPQTLQTGRKGEEKALAFLRTLGYTILHSNWRFRHLELDIVALDKEFLVIAEVKTRSSDEFGSPETFVTKAKQKKIIRAAHQYVLEHAVENELRFDIVAINNQTNEIEHIPNAFYPDGR
jgi:putative endonuclease